MTAQTCVLRVRYNTTLPGLDGLDSSSNMDTSVYADRTNSELASYVTFSDFPNGALGLPLNTDRLGRVHQDRSYSFSIKAAPVAGDCVGKPIHNLNVRGKRGNFVQTFPALEYDFTPKRLKVGTGDCVHVQWTGSDYNVCGWLVCSCLPARPQTNQGS